MTGINALFPSVDARRAMKGVRKIHWCRVARRRSAPARRGRCGFQRLGVETPPPRPTASFVQYHHFFLLPPSSLCCLITVSRQQHTHLLLWLQKIFESICVKCKASRYVCKRMNTLIYAFLCCDSYSYSTCCSHVRSRRGVCSRRRSHRPSASRCFVLSHLSYTYFIFLKSCISIQVVSRHK